jgi:signal peptidase II
LSEQDSRFLQRASVIALHAASAGLLPPAPPVPVPLFPPAPPVPVELLVPPPTLEVLVLLPPVLEVEPLEVEPLELVCDVELEVEPLDVGLPLVVLLVAELVLVDELLPHPLTGAATIPKAPATTTQGKPRVRKFMFPLSLKVPALRGRLKNPPSVLGATDRDDFSRWGVRGELERVRLGATRGWAATGVVCDALPFVVDRRARMSEDAPTTPPDAASHPVTEPETGPAPDAPDEPKLAPVSTGNPTGSPPHPPPPSSVTYRPNFAFLGVVALVSLALDLGSKAWAKGRLEDAKSFTDRHIEVVSNHLAFTFARNRGGAWGLFQDEPESVRRPLFLAISALAIGFIVSLYRKLTPRQWALRWGLPLVLGGALGNLVNRIQYNYVVDFIDYRADWMRKFNALISGRDASQVSDHWPTFNVADVAIVAGVVLMAVDMFTPTPKDVALVKTSGDPSLAAAVPVASPAPASVPASEDAGGDPHPAEAPKPQAPVET